MKADLSLVKSYSEALFGASKKEGSLEDVAAGAQLVAGLVRKDHKLASFMESPNIPRETKEDVLGRVFGQSVHKTLVNFFRLLVRRGRLELFVPTLDEFQRLFLAHKGVAAAKVVTAYNLGTEEKNKLETALNRFTGKTLHIDYEVDANVLGGVKFQCGDLLIDASVAKNLDRLERDLHATRVG